MNKLTLIFALLVGYTINAQHTISGTFSPASKYKWIIAYKLHPNSQNYIADSDIKNGSFNLSIPENATPGVYRLVYAIPQEKFFIDVIYNGKEDIELSFNKSEGVKFKTSEENILRTSHSKAIDSIESKILDFYLSKETNKKIFLSLFKQKKNTQKLFEKKSEGLLVHEFIYANTSPTPVKYIPFKEYLKFKKINYFNNMDMKNPILLASDFLNKKALNYVFKTLPHETTKQEKTEKEIINNVKQISNLIQENDVNFRLKLLFSIWTRAAESNFNLVSDFIYNSYLKDLTSATKNKKLTDQINTHNRLRLGAKSPEISWIDGESEIVLSDLTNAENYVLVFWSSTCSHCLRELPPLHDKLKQNTKITTIAVGLENDDITWKEETAKLTSFIHTIALGKWQSDYAKLFDIHSTPSYFILDKEKRIVAKPENDIVLLEFLSKK